MFDLSFLLKLFRGGRRRKVTPARKPARPWLELEALEDRSMPSTPNVFTLAFASNIAAELIQTLDGNLYVTTENGSEIERITPTGQITPSFASAAQSLTEQVSAPAPAATTTALTASANRISVGQNVTFAAVVSGATGTGTPTGTVTFMVGNLVVATVALDAGGTARLTGHFRLAGKYTIQANYSGDSRFAAGTQSIIEQVS